MKIDITLSLAYEELVKTKTAQPPIQQQGMNQLPYMHPTLCIITAFSQAVLEI